MSRSACCHGLPLQPCSGTTLMPGSCTRTRLDGLRNGAVRARGKAPMRSSFDTHRPQLAQACAAGHRGGRCRSTGSPPMRLRQGALPAGVAETTMCSMCWPSNAADTLATRRAPARDALIAALPHGPGRACPWSPGLAWPADYGLAQIPVPTGAWRTAAGTVLAQPLPRTTRRERLLRRLRSPAGAPWHTTWPGPRQPWHHRAHRPDPGLRERQFDQSSRYGRVIKPAHAHPSDQQTTTRPRRPEPALRWTCRFTGARCLGRVVITSTTGRVADS